MATPSIPSNLVLMQGNGKVSLSWDLTVGATSYNIQRSTDGVTYSSYVTQAPNTYIDTSVTVGSQYWYKIAAINGSGTGNYTNPQSIVPTISGQMTLGQIRLAAKQRADRVNSNFVTTTEWNSYITQSMYELYDLLITCDEAYYVAPTAGFISNGTTYRYPLPNGVTTFLDASNSSFVAAPFYKLMGVDMGLSNANNAWVTVNKFNFIDRNKFLYPNSASTIYGVFNCQYRIVGDDLEFIPVPSGNQPFRLWYIPRLVTPILDTDLIDGFSGWLEYVIVRAAKYALDKEESDSSKLDAELMFLTKRIEETAANRDVGQADTISDTRGANGGFNGGWGNGQGGGW